MPLTMRPSGLGQGVYKDSIDYSVFSCYSACNFDPLSWGIGVQN